MRIYHSVWNTSGELLVWGEQTQRAASVYESENGNSLERSVLEAHPFCCSAELLAKDFEDLEFEPDVLKEVSILCPSSSRLPTPSPLCAQTAGLGNGNGKQELELKPWSVPVACFSSLSTPALLTSLPAALPSGMQLSTSVDYWVEATKLLLDLLTRGRYLPSLEQEGAAFAARWRIVPTGDHDLHRFAVLASAMPPMCRALGSSGQFSQLEPAELLDSFIGQCTDALVRSFLRTQPLEPPLTKGYLSSKALAAHEWLRGLTGDRAMLTGPQHELSDLHQRVRRWGGRMLSASPREPLVTAFRLSSPPSDDSPAPAAPSGQWRLEFFVQSKNDPGQILHAEDVWNGSLQFLANTEYTADDVEESFLRNLGKAANVCAPLKRALMQAYPTQVELTPSEAYRFLRETAPLLEQSGFRLFLPDWWQHATRRLGLHLKVQSPISSGSGSRPGLLGLNQLLDYSWQIALGDRLVDVDEFKRIIQEQSPLVAIDGKWVELQPEKVKATLDFLEKSSEKPRMTALEALRIGFGAQPDAAALDVVGFSADGWLEQFINTASEKVRDVEQPASFKGSLRQYQVEGLSWLAFLNDIGIGGCLADDMGLGKTIQLLALMLHERDMAREDPLSPPVLPTLLIVPMSILDNWQRECERFSPDISIYIHHGAKRLAGRDLIQTAARHDLVVTTYALAFRDEKILSDIEWHRIALDEAQNIKNLATKQTQAVRRIMQKQFGAEDRTIPCQRLALTGTPLENHLDELWSIMDFLNPGYLGSLSQFRSRFVNPIERYRNTERAEALAKVIRPFTLRRLKTDPRVTSDLPEKMEMEVITQLLPEQAGLYQQALDQMLPQVDEASGIHRKGLVLATITKLKQICNHPTLFLKDESSLPGRSGKLSRLEELLEVFLAAGDKTLIFTQYAQMGHLLHKYLPERFGEKVLYLHGSLTQSARVKAIQQFQDPDGPPIFLLSLKAGGFGLNLTEANQVVHYDQWWNPAVESQATDRAYRIGQKRNVQVRKFICKGTLEERIAAMLKHKKNLADEIVGSTKSAITQLSTDELKSLLELTAIEE